MTSFGTVIAQPMRKSSCVITEIPNAPTGTSTGASASEFVTAAEGLTEVFQIQIRLICSYSKFTIPPICNLFIQTRGSEEAATIAAREQAYREHVQELEQVHLEGLEHQRRLEAQSRKLEEELRMHAMSRRNSSTAQQSRAAPASPAPGASDQRNNSVSVRADVHVTPASHRSSSTSRPPRRASSTKREPGINTMIGNWGRDYGVDAPYDDREIQGIFILNHPSQSQSCSVKLLSFLIKDIHVDTRPVTHERMAINLVPGHT